MPIVRLQSSATPPHLWTSTKQRRPMSSPSNRRRRLISVPSRFAMVPRPSVLQRCRRRAHPLPPTESSASSLACALSTPTGLEYLRLPLVAMGATQQLGSLNGDALAAGHDVGCSEEGVPGAAQRYSQQDRHVGDCKAAPCAQLYRGRLASNKCLAQRLMSLTAWALVWHAACLNFAAADIYMTHRSHYCCSSKPDCAYV